MSDRLSWLGAWAWRMWRAWLRCLEIESPAVRFARSAGVSQTDAIAFHSPVNHDAGRSRIHRLRYRTWSPWSWNLMGRGSGPSAAPAPVLPVSSCWQ